MRKPERQMPERYLIAPDPAAPRLTRAVEGVDQDGAALPLRVVEERPLTIYLNGQEIVTAMTIGDYPEFLAVGYLRNQGMLRADDVLRGVDYDEELGRASSTSSPGPAPSGCTSSPIPASTRSRSPARRRSASSSRRGSRARTRP
jgi:hypothetical protein